MDNNSIGPDGAGHLASALLTNTTLKYIEISYNNLKQSGIRSIGTALRVNPVVEELLGLELAPISVSVLGLPETFLFKTNAEILAELRVRSAEILSNDSKSVSSGESMSRPLSISSASSSASGRGTRRGDRRYELINDTRKRRAALDAAYAKGKKEWARGKVMLVGEGRAGKTCLVNSLLGKIFDKQSMSTLGIDEITCDISYVEQALSEVNDFSLPQQERGGRWTWQQFCKPESEFVSAVASMLLAADEMEISHDTADLSEVTGISSTHASNYSSVSPTKSLAPFCASSASSRAPQRNQPAGDATSPFADDEQLVMKYITDISDLGHDIDGGGNHDRLVISIFDFAGQSVFNTLHHLFLTKNGVYVIVFNMEEFISNDTETRRNSLNTIKFWLNSIVLHTYDHSNRCTSPWVLVGTRADRVTSLAQYTAISTTLYEHFNKHLGWKSLLTNDRGMGSRGSCMLWFYPVDNTIGRDSIVVQDLMVAMESAIKQSPYSHQHCPLGWFRAVDVMKATKKTCITLAEAELIASTCDITNDTEIMNFLTFLHEMGVIMWHDEPGLRDAIVLDPITYFVRPATIIICKHSPDIGDSTCHFLEVHQKAQRLCSSEWHNLTGRGVLHEALLNVLWAEYSTEDRFVLVKLMVKFGLVVPLHISLHEPVMSNGMSSVGVETNASFLVPALLPHFCTVPGALSEEQIQIDWSDQFYSTCYFVFSFSKYLYSDCHVIGDTDLLEYGFLPSGIYERIIGKSILWCQETSKGNFALRQVGLYRETSVLSFGRQRFRLTYVPNLCCLKVDIEGIYPLVVHDRLLSQVQKVLNECMKELKCFSVLQWPPTGRSVDGVKITSKSTTLGNIVLLPLDRIRESVEYNSILYGFGGRKIVDGIDAKHIFCQWLKPTSLLKSYDVFLSYRQGDCDAAFANALFDSFTNFTIGTTNRAIDVFIDTVRIPLGIRFDEAFSDALINSTLVVMLVTTESLDRMVQHDPNVVDHLLLEWILAVECNHANNEKATKIKGIFPVIFGSRKIGSVGTLNKAVTISVGDLFLEGLIERLSTAVPVATHMAAASHLMRNKVINDPTECKCSNLSVKEIIINEILKFNGFPAWKKNPVEKLVALCMDDLFRIVVQLHSSPSTPTSAAVATSIVHPSLLSANKSAMLRPRTADTEIEEAWGILHDESCIKAGKVAYLSSMLEDIGLLCPADVVLLKEEPVLLEDICSCLKPLQKRKFLKKADLLSA